jgi:hypothetical protein
MSAFISDFGDEIPMSKGGEHLGFLERYAVWRNRGRGKLEVVEVSNNLDELRTKHPGLKVIELSPSGEQKQL